MIDIAPVNVKNPDAGCNPFPTNNRKTRMNRQKATTNEHGKDKSILRLASG